MFTANFSGPPFKSANALTPTVALWRNERLGEDAVAADSPGTTARVGLPSLAPVFKPGSPDGHLKAHSSSGKWRRRGPCLPWGKMQDGETGRSPGAIKWVLHSGLPRAGPA